MKKFYFLIITAFAFLFSSCSNLFEQNNANGTEANFIYDNGTEKVVQIKLKFDGAVPDGMQNIGAGHEVPPKIANPNITPVSYKLKAIKLNTSGTETGTPVFSEQVSDLTKPIPITLSYGDWHIEAYGFASNGTQVLYGFYADSNNASSKGKFTVGANTTGLSISLYPKSAGGTGTVNLTIDLSNLTQEVKGIKIEWKENNVPKTQMITSSSDITSATITLQNYGDSSDAKNKTPGFYEVKITFYKEAEFKTPIFSCIEGINVFAGLETNVWKSTSHCGYLDNVGHFKLTNDIVSKRHIYYVKQGGKKTNSGANNTPLDSVQTAVDRILALNDGDIDGYTIFLLSDYTATGDETQVNDSTNPALVIINNDSYSNPLKLNIKSYGTTAYKLDANKKARVLYVKGKDSENKVSLTLENIEITGGQVQARGAGILQHDYTALTISDNVNIHNNETTDSDGEKGGGGIYSYQSPSVVGNTLTIEGKNIKIQNNTSGSLGGGIYINGCSNVKINSTGTGDAALKIDSNTAVNGGGIALTNTNTSVEINGTTIISANKSTENGGGIYIDGSGNIKISDGEIKGNTSTSNGNGIYYKNANLTIAGSPEFGSEDDIALIKNGTSYNKITVEGEISSENVIPITCCDGYAPDAEILIGDVSKFRLNDKTSYIDNSGKICGMPDLKDYTSFASLSSGQYTYVISDKAGMDNLRTISREDTDCLADYTFILKNDFDMGSELWTNGIGYVIDGDSVFKGTFDGNYHKISGININATSSYVALFPKMEGCVKNLIVEGTVVGNATYTAGIAGALSDSGAKIDNCISFLNVTTSSNYAGGIAGNNSHGKIINCVNLGVVKGKWVGGILGDTNKVYNCVNLGKVYGSANAGNIVNNKNDNDNDEYIQNCYSAFTPYKTSASAVIKNAYIPIPPTSVISTFNSKVTGNNGYNKWSETNTITVNGTAYPVPVKGFGDLGEVTINYGTDPNGTYNVGDIVYKDGSVERKDDCNIVKLNSTLKDAAVGIVFVTNFNNETVFNDYGFDEGENLNSGNTVLMVGVHNVLDEEEYSNGIKVADSSVDNDSMHGLFDGRGGNRRDGSRFDFSIGVYASFRFPNNFPVIQWVLNYGNKYSGTDFSSGWYLPTRLEGRVLYATYNSMSNIYSIFNDNLFTKDGYETCTTGCCNPDYAVSPLTGNYIYVMDNSDRTKSPKDNWNAVAIWKLK